MSSRTRTFGFSDTVEESSGGWGGLGYCMDDDDVEVVDGFHAGKGESSSNGSAAASGGASGSADVSVKAENARALKQSQAREGEHPIVIGTTGTAQQGQG